MTIRLHIDRLVVDAALGSDARRIEREVGAALHAALARSTGWRPATERQGRVDVAPGGALGVRIGSAVHAAVVQAAGSETGPPR